MTEPAEGNSSFSADPRFSRFSSRNLPDPLFDRPLSGVDFSFSRITRGDLPLQSRLGANSGLPLNFSDLSANSVPVGFRPSGDRAEVNRSVSSRELSESREQGAIVDQGRLAPQELSVAKPIANPPPIDEKLSARFKLPIIYRMPLPQVDRGISGVGGRATPLIISLEALYSRDPDRAQRTLAEYYPGYAAAFPDTDELLAPAMLEKLTSDPANSWDISIVRRNREIVGGYHTIVAPVGSFIASLGDYLWVSPPERGTGLAKRIYHEILGMRQRMGASAHFGEVNDPFAQPAAKRELDESGGTPPDARVRFWSKQGRLACDAPWLQPALQDGLQEVNYLMLTVHPLVSDFKASITRAEYLAIWESFYSPLADYIDLDPTRVRLRALLGDQEEIQFIPMEQRRSYLAR